MLNNDNYILEFPKGNSNNGGGSIAVGNTVFVDAINGNDGTALRGRMDRPCANIAQAKILAVDGDNIVIWTNLTNQEELGISTKHLKYYSFAKSIGFSNFIFQTGKSNGATCFYGFGTELSGQSLTVNTGDLNIYCYALYVTVNDIIVSGGWSLYIETRREIDGLFSFVNINIAATSQIYLKNTTIIGGEIRINSNGSGQICMENVIVSSGQITANVTPLFASNIVQLINVIFLNNVAPIKTNVVLGANKLQLFVIGRIDTKFDFYPNDLVFTNRLQGWLYNYEPNLVIKTPFTTN